MILPLRRPFLLLAGVFLIDIVAAVSAIVYFRIPITFQLISIQGSNFSSLPLTILVIVLGLVTDVVVILFLVSWLKTRMHERK